MTRAAGVTRLKRLLVQGEFVPACDVSLTACLVTLLRQK